MYSITDTAPRFRILYGAANPEATCLFVLWPDGTLRQNGNVVADEELSRVFDGWNHSDDLVIRILVSDEENTRSPMIADVIGRLFTAYESAQKPKPSVVVYISSEKLAQRIGISTDDMRETDTGVKYTTPKVKLAQ